MTELILVVGICSVGKTHHLIQELQNQNIYSNVLVYAPNDEQQYIEKAKATQTSIQDIEKNFCKPKTIHPYRRSDVKIHFIHAPHKAKPEEHVKNMNKIISKFKHGILVLDNKDYYSHYTNTSRILQSIQPKSENKCIVLVYQSFGSIPKELILLANRITLYEVADYKSVAQHIPLIKKDLLFLANQILKNTTGKNKHRRHVHIHHWKFLEGNYTKQEYQNACLDLLIENAGLNKYNSNH